MLAIIATGGKQQLVEAGKQITVEKIPGEPGSAATFDRVLLVADGDAVTIGTPTVAGAKVTGTIVAQRRADKVAVVKFKRKVRYRRRRGHRQHETVVKISAISQ